MKELKLEFTNWVKFEDKDKLEGVKFPGIYCIAISDFNLDLKPWNLNEDIKYIGMTNRSLKNRLSAFSKSLLGESGHGGALRFEYKHKYEDIKEKLYVAVQSFECNINSNSPKDLNIKGDVLKHEFTCFAKYVETYGRLPEFNDKKKSSKRKHVIKGRY